MATNNHRNLRVRVQPYLARLRAREMTNREVAGLLGCNEQALSRLLGTMGFEKEPAVDRKAASLLNAERKAFRFKLANDPTISMEEAAARAGVALRTIYRYSDKSNAKSRAKK